MFDYLKKRLQQSREAYSRQVQLRINDENEYLAMSCGTFNPRFLEKIKKCNEVVNRPKI